MILCLVIILVCLSVGSSSTCNFPDDLTGTWVSSVKGVVHFNTTMLLGYHVNIPGIPLMDFECQENHGSKYVLRGLQKAQVFSQTIKFSLCLDIRKVSDNEYDYYYATEYSPVALEHIHGVKVDREPNMTDICNKNQSYDQVPPHKLRRNVSLGDGFQSAECPREILAEYQQIVIIDQSQNIKCPYSKLDICSNKTLLAFPNGLTCSINNVSLSGQGLVSCVRHNTIGNVIYVTAWTNDTQLKHFSTDFEFVCFAFDLSGPILRVRIYEEYCTGYVTSSPLLDLQLSSISVSCSPIRTTRKSSTPMPTTTTSGPIKLTNQNQSIIPYVLVPTAVVTCILIALFVFICCVRKNNCCSDPKQTDPGFSDISLEQRTNIAFVSPPSDNYGLPEPHVRKR